MPNTELCRSPKSSNPDFEISNDNAAHEPTVQKESSKSRAQLAAGTGQAARRKRTRALGGASLFALGSLAAWLTPGCVTGQVVDDGTGDTTQPSAGSASMNTPGGTGSNVTHPSGGSGGSGGTSGVAGSTSHAGTTSVGGSGGVSNAGGVSGTGTGAGGTGGSGGSAGAAMAGAAGAPVTECSNKRGVAYAFDVSSANPDMSAMKSGVSWFYGWSTAPSGNAKPVYAAMNMEFVPMVFGGGFNVSNVVNSIPAGAKYLLGFNEPNFGNQANLTAQAAASLWPQVESIAAQKQLQIVSPAVNYCAGNCNQTDPFQWLDDFFAACPNCKVDYIGAHWYACTINALEDYITMMKQYNKPIWLTEFACADGGPYTPDQVKTYALQAENWLEHEPSIFRYSWFSGRTDAIPNVNLLAGSGVLTDLGTAYVNQAPMRCP
jgi:hypothetical protein